MSLIERSLLQVGKKENSLVSIYEPSLDFIVRVDRSNKSVYPNGMKKVVNFSTPELLMAPTVYDLSEHVKFLFLEGQKNSRGMIIQEIFDEIKNTDILVDCLSFADLLSIQAKGPCVYKQLYGGLKVYALASVARELSGRRSLCAPYLQLVEDKAVELRWEESDKKLDGGCPGLRFDREAISLDFSLLYKNAA